MADRDGVTKEQVLSTLSQIEDPDLHQDIGSLGFIPEDAIHISDGQIAVKIVLTTPACPVRDEMKAQAEELLLALPGIEKVEVEMDASVR
ncbi:MAG TPA: iron-sulfur cluster assembly protein, partial [Dehalococcoidia bacterium]